MRSSWGIQRCTDIIIVVLIAYIYADIDECTNGTLNGCSEDKNQLCVNTDGSYYCECKQGFQREQIGADDTCQG